MFHYQFSSYFPTKNHQIRYNNYWQKLFYLFLYKHLINLVCPFLLISFYLVHDLLWSTILVIQIVTQHSQPKCSIICCRAYKPTVDHNLVLKDLCNLLKAIAKPKIYNTPENAANISVLEKKRDVWHHDRSFKNTPWDFTNY